MVLHVVQVTQDVARVSVTIALPFGKASAGETIATDYWEYEAPANWSMDRTSSPPRSIGPRHELVQLSSQSIPSIHEGENAVAVREKIETAARELIVQAATESDLRNTKPLTKTVLAPELKVYEIVSESLNGRELLAQFFLVGPHAIVLITFEASPTDGSLDDIRRSILRMKWAA